MLNEVDAITTIPVKDMDEAAEFYEQALGLKRLLSNEGGYLYESGSSKIFVYESQYAGTNKGTTVSWEVEDLEATMESLRQKAVTFEQYDLSGAVRKGDVHTTDTMRTAWFRDLSGNILNITTPIYSHSKTK